MWRATLTSLPRRWLQVLLTLIVVTLGFGILAACLGVGSLARTATSGIVASSMADVTVVSTAPPNRPNPLITEENLQQIRNLPGVKAAQGLIRGDGLWLVNQSGKVLNQQLIPIITGNYLESPQPKLDLVTGRAPKSNTEVVVDASTLALSGQQLGEPITFVRAGSDPPITATVVGVIKPETTEPDSARFALFSLEAARQLFLANRDGWNSIWIQAKPDTNLSELATNIQALLPRDYQAISAKNATSSAQYGLYPSLGYLQLGSWLAALVALVLAAFLINGAAAQLLEHRRTELAKWQRLGASQLQLGLLLRIELALIALLGSLLALSVGNWLTSSIQNFANAQGWWSSHSEVALNDLEVFGLLILGVGLTLIVTYRQVRSSLETSLLPNSPNSPAATGRVSDTAWTGLGFLLIGGIGIALVVFVPTLPRLPIWGVAAASTVVIGAVIALPALALPLLLISQFLLQLVLRVTGKLTVRNITRSPSRLARLGAIITLITALATGFAALAASAKTSASTAVPETLRGDFILTTAGGDGFSRKLTAELAKLPGASAVAGFGWRTAFDGSSPQRVITADPGELAKALQFQLVEGREPAVADEAMADVEFAASRGLPIGSKLKLTINGAEAVLRIVGHYQLPAEFSASQLVTPRKTFVDRGLPDIDSVVVLKVASNQLLAFQTGASKTIANDPLLRLRTVSQFAENHGERFASLKPILGSGFSIVLILTAIAASYLLIIRSSREASELQSLRRLGTQSWQLALSLVIESLLLLLLPIVVGIGAGIAASWGLVKSLGAQGYSQFAIDPAQPGELLWAGTLAALLAAIIPAIWLVWVSGRNKITG